MRTPCLVSVSLESILMPNSLSTSITKEMAPESGFIYSRNESFTTSQLHTERPGEHQFGVRAAMTPCRRVDAPFGPAVAHFAVTAAVHPGDPMAAGSLQHHPFSETQHEDGSARRDGGGASDDLTAQFTLVKLVQVSYRPLGPRSWMNDSWLTSMNSI